MTAALPDSIQNEKNSLERLFLDRPGFKVRPVGYRARPRANLIDSLINDGLNIVTANSLDDATRFAMEVTSALLTSEPLLGEFEVARAVGSVRVLTGFHRAQMWRSAFQDQRVQVIECPVMADASALTLLLGATSEQLTTVPEFVVVDNGSLLFSGLGDTMVASIDDAVRGVGIPVLALFRSLKTSAAIASSVMTEIADQHLWLKNEGIGTVTLVPQRGGPSVDLTKRLTRDLNGAATALQQFEMTSAQVREMGKFATQAEGITKVKSTTASILATVHPESFEEIAGTGDPKLVQPFLEKYAADFEGVSPAVIYPDEPSF